MAITLKRINDTAKDIFKNYNFNYSKKIKEQIRKELEEEIRREEQQKARFKEELEDMMRHYDLQSNYYTGNGLFYVPATVTVDDVEDVVE